MVGFYLSGKIEVGKLMLNQKIRKDIFKQDCLFYL